MDKSIFLILLLTPGFITKIIDKAFGNDDSVNFSVDALMRYFVYSMISIFLALITSQLFGYINIYQHVDEMRWSLTGEYILKFLFFANVWAVLMGLMWNCVGRDKVINAINKINSKLKNRNSVYWESSLLLKKFNDGEEHFVVIKKGEQNITSGFIRGLSSPSSKKEEFWVLHHDDYDKWIQHFKDNNAETNIDISVDINSPDVLRHIIGVYYCTEDDLIIEEHKFPASWKPTDI